jgi:hemolysin III
MVSSNSRPAEVIWNYDRVELIADGIVHAIGVSLGLVGAIAIIVSSSLRPIRSTILNSRPL